MQPSVQPCTRISRQTLRLQSLRKLPNFIHSLPENFPSTKPLRSSRLQTRMAPYPCSCGRAFQSVAALAQHRAAKHCLQHPTDRVERHEIQPHIAQTARPMAGNQRAGKNRGSRDSHLWRGALGLDPIAEINSANLQATGTRVTISTPSQLVCSYNWQSTGGFDVPGHAPVWKDIPLPTTLPRDPKHSSSKPTFTTSTYPFQQIFQATSVMSPDFRFDKIDIVTTRNSLRKFLDFCAGRRQENFRVNLSVVENTLFIEQYNVINMAQGTGWGHSFEKAFTRYPPGLENSTTHDRFLQYSIGDLNCLVGFEVDASYEGDGGESTRVQAKLEELQDGLGQLSLDPSTARTNTIGECSIPPPSVSLPPGTKIMPQETAAELKTSKVGKYAITAYLPQLWFGRTCWLIVASHNEGTVVSTKITDVSSRLTQWENERQQDLQKLATFLAEVRGAIRKAGKRCCLIYEKGVPGGPNVAKLFAVKTTGTGSLVPENMLSQFWG